jgi:hypothetical protein
MSPFRLRETSRTDWEGTVVEVWDEENELVAQVWRDGDEVLVEFGLDADGDPFVLDVGDLLTALDNATRMLGDGSEDDADVDPIERLAEEFDHLAVHRGPEDEGFFPPQIAVPFIRRCESLGLAVVGMEGFHEVAGEVQPAPGHRIDLSDIGGDEAWATFRASCNVQAEAVMARWPRTPGFLVAFEIRDAQGEDYVM